MNKFYYRLMTPGTRTRTHKDKEVVWKVAYYSEMQHTFAKNKEIALMTIREKLKSKWIGFRMYSNYEGFNNGKI